MERAGKTNIKEIKKDALQGQGNVWFLWFSYTSTSCFFFCVCYAKLTGGNYSLI